MYKGAAEMAHIKLLSKEINENIINGSNAGRKFSWTYSTILIQYDFLVSIKNTIGRNRLSFAKYIVDVKNSPVSSQISFTHHLLINMHTVSSSFNLELE